MLAKFERNTSLLRAPLSLPGMVEMFLDPLSLILSLIACALYHGDTVDEILTQLIVQRADARSLCVHGRTSRL